MARWAVLGAVLFAGCGPEAPTAEPRPTVAVVTSEPSRDIDIVFAVNTGGSMGDAQDALADAFGAFVDGLRDVDGLLPNVHIAVVSTDVGAGPYSYAGCMPGGDNGEFQNAPRVAGCSPPAGAFISDVEYPMGERLVNYDGDIADAFACISRLGIDGCGFEQPLESLWRALDGRDPFDEFWRPDAWLALVIVSDDDDCSASDPSLFDPDDPSFGALSIFRCLEHGVVCDPDEPRVPGEKHGCRSREDSAYLTPIGEYADRFRELKRDPSKVIATGVIGNRDPVAVDLDMNGNPRVAASCASILGATAPTVRLGDFFDRFPGRNENQSICASDLIDPLTEVARRIRTSMFAGCLEGDLAMPLDCVVEQVHRLGFPDETRESVPACEGGAGGTCFQLVEDRDYCADTETALSLEIQTPNGPDEGASYVASCRLRE